MTKTKYDTQKRKVILSKMDDLLTKLKQHTLYLKETNKILKEIDDDIDMMKAYYFNEWIDDYEQFQSEKYNTLLSQDAVYNTLQDLYEQKVKLLKNIVDKID